MNERCTGKNNKIIFTGNYVHLQTYGVKQHNTCGQFCSSKNSAVHNDTRYPGRAWFNVYIKYWNNTVIRMKYLRKVRS